MNYNLTPSLKHIALVKILTTLWNQDDIRALMTKFCFPVLDNKRREEWHKIEDKVVEKVPQLPQPGALKEEILGLIKPIGLQILQWMEYHIEERYFLELPLNLCWTSQGTVDKKKTAQTFIKNDNLDITIRYKLACIYCLDDDIPKLWNKMPECRKNSFYCKVDPEHVRQQAIVVLWTYDIKGDLADLYNMIEGIWHCKCSPYQYAFEHAAAGGNKAASEYFLQKLTSREREESLVRSAGSVATARCNRNSKFFDFPKEQYSEILCLLLSQMDEEQQIEVFKNNRYKVLKCLLDWPWQGFFMETANRMWDFLSGNDCNLFLNKMVDRVIEGHKDYDYLMLFMEFWQQSPNAHKRYVIDGCASGSLLSKLFMIKDKKNISLVLKDATLEEKKKIIFNFKSKVICERFIYSNEWDSLKFFVQECISSKDIVIKFKEELKKHIIHRFSEEKLEREKDIWNKCFQLLDNLAQENNKKKSIDEAESRPAKRLCSMEFKEVAHSLKK